MSSHLSSGLLSFSSSLSTFYFLPPFFFFLVLEKDFVFMQAGFSVYAGIAITLSTFTFSSIIKYIKSYPKQPQNIVIVSHSISPCT